MLPHLLFLNFLGRIDLGLFHFRDIWRGLEPSLKTLTENVIICDAFPTFIKMSQILLLFSVFSLVPFEVEFGDNFFLVIFHGLVIAAAIFFVLYLFGWS